jgi:hypothetical protein
VSITKALPVNHDKDGHANKKNAPDYEFILIVSEISPLIESVIHPVMCLFRSAQREEAGPQNPAPCHLIPLLLLS